jgi:hypothetical protein
MTIHRNAARPMRYRAGQPAFAVVSALAIGALVLTGCSSTPSAVTTTSGAASSSGTTVPVTYRNTISLRQNVTLSGCTASKGGWRATGQARNPGPAARRYAVTVYFTNGQATVLGSGRTTVDVGAGRSRRWVVEAGVDGPALVRCVLVGVG